MVIYRFYDGKQRYFATKGEALVAALEVLADMTRDETLVIERCEVALLSARDLVTSLLNEAGVINVTFPVKRMRGSRIP